MVIENFKTEKKKCYKDMLHTIKLKIFGNLDFACDDG